MLDPAKIQATMTAGNSLGENSHSTLSQPFLQGVSSMNMSGPGAAQSVMSNVTSSCSQMLDKMNGVFNGLQSDVTAHQQMQTAEEPKDFSVAMEDLRLKVAKGFPSEQKDYLTKMPKL